MTAFQKPPATQQFVGIQILRFVAAMLVVVMHITQAFSVHVSGQGAGSYWAAGSSGVDIFFVISGFVMAMTVSGLSTGRHSRSISAWIFFKRRILRIAPLYWFYTLLKVCLLVALPSLASRSSIEPWHLASSLFFIPTVSPWGDIQPVLPVGWTLNFEMIFYAVFALAILIGAPILRFCLAVFMLLFAIAYLLPESIALAFYAQLIIFEFILGICIARVLTRYLKPLQGLLCVIAGVAVMFGLSSDASHDRFFTWGLGAALLVWGVTALESWVVRMPLASTLSYLGDASYSIYLSHTFVVPAGVMALSRLGVQNPIGIGLCVAAAVIVTGCLSHQWLEKPMTAWLKRVLFPTPNKSYPTWTHKHER